MRAIPGRYYVYTHTYRLIPNAETLADAPEIVEALSTGYNVTSDGYATLAHARQAANLIIEVSGNETAWSPVTLLYIARVEEIIYDAKKLVETCLQAPDPNNDVLELP